MIIIAIVLGGIVAGAVIWALDVRQSHYVRRKDYTEREWAELFMERWR